MIHRQSAGRSCSTAEMIEKVKIHIGEYYACDVPTRIYTLLGSCVAVCFFDPVKRIGGMNHILLPGRANMKSFNPAASFGINAMELLINRIMSLGGDRRNLKAKIFGGAKIIPVISEEYSMGKKNSDFVIEFLNNEKIKIVNMDIGGTQTRKIYFHTDTGVVYIKYIPPIFRKLISKKEEFKLRRIKREINKAGKISFFDD